MMDVKITYWTDENGLVNSISLPVGWKILGDRNPYPIHIDHNERSHELMESRHVQPRPPAQGRLKRQRALRTVYK